MFMAFSVMQVHLALQLICLLLVVSVGVATQRSDWKKPSYDSRELNLREGFDHSTTETVVITPASVFNCSVLSSKCKQKCPAGSRANLNDALCACCENVGYCQEESRCEPCHQGTCQPQAGSVHCIDCPAGTKAENESSTRCTDCGEGYYSNHTGSAECSTCDPGSFANGTNSSYCPLCPKGHYQPQEGQVSCQVCRAGNYTSEKGCSECMQCEPGYYSNTNGSTKCTKCKAGTISSHDESTSCEPCDNGTFSVEGQSSCTMCYFGSYCDHEQCEECAPCPAGKEAKLMGASGCTMCEPGWEKPATGVQLCSPCASGWYQKKPGQTSCNECQETFYCPCPYCDPEPCPAGALCPSGSAYPQYRSCGAMFDNQDNKCVPTVGFYVLLCTMLLFVFGSAAGLYRAKRRYIRHGTASEETPLTQDRAPIYQGF